MSDGATAGERTRTREGRARSRSIGRVRETPPTPRSSSADDHPGAAEQTGEAVGGVGGTLVGAGIGSAAGPVGTIIGGIAGALGGWWAGEKVGRSAEDWNEHDAHYREHHAARPREGVTYEDARVGYAVGHIAGRNPDYRGRSFEDVEPHLRDNWRHERYDYEIMRPFVRAGYLRTSTSR